MRPVILEMAGFASFREPTRVDFTDADYFVLVGTTGAGKSTVIDAMTFALYGTVARWGHETMVTPALAPTVNRATVRLIFDIGGARYSAAREVRRIGGKKPQVTVKSVRLERFHDAGALGDPGDETDVLAADSEVTGAVEELLGLTFKHFCTCVALPQGDFADFLHATAGERQRILTKLLGLGVYEQIARLAGELMTRQNQRADTLTDQLDTYTDATAEAAAALGAQVSALVDLESRVRVAVPELNDAVATRTAADARVRTLCEEQTRLTDLRLPPGVSELGEKQQAADQSYAMASAALETAQLLEGQARADLRAAPDRHALETNRSDWAELDTIEQDLPQLGAEVASAAGKSGVALTEAAAADATDKRIRAALTAASAELDDAQRKADDHRAECSLLGNLQPPANLADQALTLTEVRQRLQDAEAHLALSRDSADGARSELAEEPDRSVLTAALTRAVELREVCGEQLGFAQEYANRRAQLVRARGELENTEQAVDAARAAFDAAENVHKALVLRAHLAPGESCPVCEQEVRALPSTSSHPRVSEARAALDSHQAEHARLMSVVRELETAVQQDVMARSGALELAERHRLHLTTTSVVGSVPALDQPCGVATTDADLERISSAVAELVAVLQSADDRRARAESMEREAAERLSAAMDARDEARRQFADAEGALSSTRTALRRARDPLVGLGAPAMDHDDLVAGWTELTTWALATLTSHQATLMELEQAARAAADRVEATKVEAASVAGKAESSREAATEAARAEQAAESRLEAAEDRQRHLRERLATAPAAEDVAKQLAHVTELEEVMLKSEGVLATAKTNLEPVADAKGRIEDEVVAARKKLLGTRDTVVALGAPDLDTSDLLEAWTALLGWAAEAITQRNDLLHRAQRAQEAAVRKLNDIERAIVDDLTRHELRLDDGSVRDRAPAVVASALAGGRAAFDEMNRRIDAAGRLRLEVEDARKQTRVAKLLSDHMRTNKFPRWLIASALENLVIDASTTLFELSGGQFELARRTATSSWSITTTRTAAGWSRRCQEGRLSRRRWRWHSRCRPNSARSRPPEPPSSGRSSWTKASAAWTKPHWTSSPPRWRTWRRPATAWSVSSRMWPRSRNASRSDTSSVVTHPVRTSPWRACDAGTAPSQLDPDAVQRRQLGRRLRQLSRARPRRLEGRGRHHCRDGAHLLGADRPACRPGTSGGRTVRGWCASHRCPRVDRRTGDQRNPSRGGERGHLCLVCCRGHVLLPTRCAPAGVRCTTRTVHVNTSRRGHQD